MNRKDFIKKAAIALPFLGTVPSKALEPKEKNEIELPIGMEHLPNKPIVMGKSVLHKANTRGYADHGWLKSNHSFSFASYYNPEREQFGALRVLNDDQVAAGMGFGTHPHRNMEIISIPLSGALEHKDSMGNTTVIRKNEVQILSAGTGITHSEYNKNKDEEVKFLQIWVFPKEQNIKPRYDQMEFNPKDRKNRLQTIVSPVEDGVVTIKQDAWFSLGDFDAGHAQTYKVQKPKENGVYIFVLEGAIEVNGQLLDRRDGYGLWEVDQIDLKANNEAEVLVMEVPMMA